LFTEGGVEVLEIGDCRGWGNGVVRGVMNLPNTLSLFRIILAAVFTLAMSLEVSWGIWVALGAFIIASITDWLDGYLARKLQLVTDLGKLLDPLADKILVAAAFVSFSAMGICPAWVTIAILFREFAVTGLRLLLVEKRVVLPADQWGKWKTVLQMVYCIWVLGALSFYPEGNMLVADILMYGALALTVISGANYIRGGAPHLK